ncbi:MAG: hypothetical protein ACJ8AG_21750 [Ktedonobacteraceae bacterium]
MNSGYVVGFPGADESAVAAINRALRVVEPIHDILDISLKFIIGTGRDTSGPTNDRSILFICIIESLHDKYCS